jgi:pyruvate dehydrogenase E1 component alpha subunit
MNLAALWNLPVLFCCENNLYAMGTALARSESQVDIALKAASYEMPAWQIDGMDVLAVREATHRACASIRGGGGPHLIEFRTYRFRAHSMYDPELYRSKEEVAAWKERDPILQFRKRSLDAGVLSESDLVALEAEVETEVAAAVAFAEAGDWEPVSSLLRDVTAPKAP